MHSFTQRVSETAQQLVAGMHYQVRGFLATWLIVTMFARTRLCALWKRLRTWCRERNGFDRGWVAPMAASRALLDTRDLVVHAFTKRLRLSVACYPRALHEAVRRHHVAAEHQPRLSAAMGASLLLMDGKVDRRRSLVAPHPRGSRARSAAWSAWPSRRAWRCTRRPSHAWARCEPTSRRCTRNRTTT